MSSGNVRLGIIPARVRSTRFPNKITAIINKKPMIQYVWEAARQAELLTDLLVATEDRTIAEVVRGFGGKVVLTPATFESGSDRVAYVARQYSADTVINIQGDEPLLKPKMIDRLILALESDPGVQMATLAVRKNLPDQLNDSNVVKVVVSEKGRALYFSRHPLSTDAQEFLKHIGIYAYRYESLMRFCELPKSRLEKVERLEQLRALEHGFQIRVVEVEEDTIEVNTPSDLAKVERYLKEQEVVL